MSLDQLAEVPHGIRLIWAVADEPLNRSAALMTLQLGQEPYTSTSSASSSGNGARAARPTP